MDVFDRRYSALRTLLASQGGGKLWQTLLVGLLGGFVPTKTSDIGTVYIRPVGDVPKDFLACNGSEYKASVYPELYNALSGIYGERSDNGEIYFKVPDYRGYFLRGWDQGAGVDPDRTSRTDRGDGILGDDIGTRQIDQFKSHDHDGYSNKNLYYSGGGGRANDAPNGRATSGRYWSTLNTGGSETRPKNVNVMYVIRAEADIIDNTYSNNFTNLQEEIDNNANKLEQTISSLNATHQVDFLSVQQNLLQLQQEILAIKQWLNSTPSPSDHPTKQPTPNNPPIVAQQIPTQYATIDKLYEYIIPSDTFTDQDGDTLTLSATLSDGGNLPDWLEFVPDSREFLGYPQSEDTGIIKVKLTAADPDGAQASEVFFLVVRESTSNPTQKPTLEPISSSILPNSNKEGSTSLLSQNNSILIGIVSGISGGMCTALCGVAACCLRGKRQKKSQQEDVAQQNSTHDEDEEKAGEKARLSQSFDDI